MLPDLWPDLLRNEGGDPRKSRSSDDRVEPAKRSVARVEDELPGDVDMEAVEGNPRLVTHLRRERSSDLIRRKKRAVLKETGRLACEVCGFDFKGFYGPAGEGFCEVHHLAPLGESDGETRTRMSDLAIICSNCHRIIHRMKPMPSIHNLRALVKKMERNL